MTPEKLENYKASLYQRVREAVLVRRGRIEGGDWQPELNKCHHNVSTLCFHDPRFKPVRGWLYFDMPGLPEVVFLSHSVVQTPEGHLSDITPSNASQDYPFIASNLAEDEYANLVEDLGHTELKYFPNRSGF